MCKNALNPYIYYFLDIISLTFALSLVFKIIFLLFFALLFSLLLSLFFVRVSSYQRPKVHNRN